MAARTRNRQADAESQETPDATPTDAPKVEVPSLDNLLDADADMATLRREPNPYQDVTKRSDVLDAEKPKMLPVPDEATAKKVTNLLRRDATENEVGLSIVTKTVRGQLYVVFRSKSAKRKLAHTTAEIREWAETQGLPTENGWNEDKTKYSAALPKSTRDAFRQAHNLPVSA